ncbi:MAG: hypothetical protein QMD36_05265 [Candidatus Aenigmarchaeota archaeon]|nr:hypothetical protein [Candidatus Aenigmarchaeota archaeon]
MVIPIIIGIILFLIAIYIGFKILKNILMGIVFIVLIVIASFLIFGSIPNFREIPFIGKFFPKIPTTPQEVIIAIKDIFYSIDILEVNRDSQNNLLIAVANTGKLEVSNTTIFIDNQTTSITNKPKDPLKSGEVTIVQTDWNKDFSEISVQTKQVNATYKPK